MKIKDKIDRLVNTFLPTFGRKVAFTILLGIGVGLGAYLVYMSMVWSYLSDNPATCVNCHVMEPYYATWMHSSHGYQTTCNDCHVPHDNIFNKYYFKAVDGLRHSYVFTMKGEPQAIKALPASQAVIYENCVRCHTQLNQEFVKTGMIQKSELKDGTMKACWDCHRDVPHGGVNSLANTPHAIVPLPKSPLPSWIKNLQKRDK